MGHSSDQSPYVFTGIVPYHAIPPPPLLQISVSKSWGVRQGACKGGDRSSSCALEGIIALQWGIAAVVSHLFEFPSLSFQGLGGNAATCKLCLARVDSAMVLTILTITHMDPKASSDFLRFNLRFHVLVTARGLTTKGLFSLEESLESPSLQLLWTLGSAKTDPVRLKRGFEEGPLKDDLFCLFDAYRSPMLERRKLLAKCAFLLAKRALF